MPHTQPFELWVPDPPELVRERLRAQTEFMMAMVAGIGRNVAAANEGLDTLIDTVRTALEAPPLSNEPVSDSVGEATRASRPQRQGTQR